MSDKWSEKSGKLFRGFKFADFAEALAFVNKVGALAEEANHHPDINFGWGYVDVTLLTHSENAITDKDHELAVKIDDLPLDT